MNIKLRNKHLYKNVDATVNERGNVTIIETTAKYIPFASCTIETAENGMLLTFHYGSDKKPSTRRVITDTWSLRDAIEANLMMDIQVEIPFVPEHYTEEDLGKLREAGADIPLPEVTAG